ncbi:MAG: GFA family protein, partial [Pseudomonadota bacterium]
MQVTGRCHCGEITFEAEIDPQKPRICHCTDCQKLSGGPFRVVVAVSEADFRITAGTPKIYVK